MTAAAGAAPAAPAPAVRLIERVHADGASLAAEQPLVFDPRFDGRVLALDAEGAPRAACTLLVRELVTPRARLRLGLVGSVTTDPTWRRKGLATRLLVEAEAELARRGCHVAMLWADDPAFYYARGWRPAGAEVDLAVPRETASRLPAPDGARPLAPEDAPAVHALYAAHPARVERTAAETAALLGCPAMDALVLERGGSVVAYACRGRGRDLADVVHEWGGAPEDVAALVRAHLERRPEGAGAYVLAPLGAEALVERLVAAGADATLGVLGLARVVDVAACRDLLAELAGAEARLRVAPGPPPDVRLAVGDGELALDDETLLALLLPARGLAEDVESFKAGCGLEGAAFPLDAFLWGLDSI